MGPAARTFAQTRDARRQFRGWCSNRAARRQAGARQPRSGSWKRMCASKRKACLRRERAAARVIAVAQEPDLSCYYSGALRSSAATSSSELS